MNVFLLDDFASFSGQWYALNASGLIQIHVVSWCVQTVCGGARDRIPPLVDRQPQLKICRGPGYPEHCNYHHFLSVCGERGGINRSSVI